MNPFASLAVAMSFLSVIGCNAEKNDSDKSETHTDTDTEANAQVVTDDGVVIQGVPGELVDQYLGIRYAKPPVDALRFLPPQPLDDDEVTTDATEFGNRNYQVGVIDIFLGERATPGEQSEDCLFLNVYTPRDVEEDTPVMVWIHGGAYMNGSGNEYDMIDFVEDHGLVVVTINYRLGIFGFLNLRELGGAYADSVNLGIQDQVAALAWVEDNIAAFGGDPSNVTIAGQSAGANAVFTLLGTPSAEGLFDKAMAFSGGEVLNPPPDHVELLKGYLGVGTDQQVIDRLSEMTPEQLLEVQANSGFSPNTSVDGVVVSQRPSEAVKGMSSDVPIFTGTVQDDGTTLAPPFAPTEEVGNLFISFLAADIGEGDPVPYLAYLDETLPDASAVDRLSRVWYDVFRSSALRIASTASAHGAGGWVYNFEVPTDFPEGITHGSSLPFLFKWVEPGHPGILFHEPTPENMQISEDWSNTVVEFVRTGSPNGGGLPEWPRFEADTYGSMRIGTGYEFVIRADEPLFEVYGIR
ncbi:MAG: carboxylesterase family protein [Myxococcota bacterium]